MYYLSQNMLHTFAQVYGGGNYGASAYQATTTTDPGGGTDTTGGSTGSSGGVTVGASGAATGATAGTSNGGQLSNTGFDVLVVATIACVIILAALVVRVWKRPASKS